MNLTTSAMGTAVGLSTDLNTGVIDRFRTLPMWRAGRAGRPVHCRPLSAAICVAIVAVTGLAIGWRPHAGVASVLAGFGCCPAVQLRPVLGLRLPRPDQQGPGVGAGRGPDRPVSRWRSCPTPWSRRHTCRRGWGPSPTGIRSARSPRRAGTCSATPIRPPLSTRGRCNTPSPLRWPGRSPSWLSVRPWPPSCTAVGRRSNNAGVQRCRRRCFSMKPGST